MKSKRHPSNQGRRASWQFGSTTPQIRAVIVRWIQFLASGCRNLPENAVHSEYCP